MMTAMGGKVSGGKLKGFWMWEQGGYDDEKSIHYFYCFFNYKLKHYFLVLEPAFGRWEVKEANRYKISFSGDICYDDASASKRDIRKIKSKLNNRRIEASFINKNQIDLHRDRASLIKLYPEEIPQFLLADVTQELQTRKSRYDFLQEAVLKQMGETVQVQVGTIENGSEDDLVKMPEMKEGTFGKNSSTVKEKLQKLKLEIQQEFASDPGDKNEDVWEEWIESIEKLIQTFEDNTKPGMFRRVMIFLAVFIISLILF